MGITLSHVSALDALRKVRAEGLDVRIETTAVALRDPQPWVGSRWVPRVFEDSSWYWGVPSKGNPLHVVVSDRSLRPQSMLIESHACTGNVPARSFLWLDEHATMVSPGLLFVQLANVLTFPALVLLGYELCGNFTRDAKDPLNGPVTRNVPVAITCEELREFVDAVDGTRGVGVARRAAKMIADNALSAPEAVLATMCSLPPNELGYDLGPVELNKRVQVRSGSDAHAPKIRVPDIMLTFAPIGFNYDGKDHLDLDALVEAVLRKGTVDQDAMNAVRSKYVDDLWRNRELVAAGKLVLPVVKEDFATPESIDALIEQVLACSNLYFGINTTDRMIQLENTEQRIDRHELLRSFLPNGAVNGSSHGKM